MENYAIKKYSFDNLPFYKSEKKKIEQNSSSRNAEEHNNKKVSEQNGVKIWSVG